MAEKKYEKSWSDQVAELYDQINNRPDFQYNPNEDSLFQSTKDQYVLGGRRAMEDTMGQAASLTGGYNSSYAQAAGQQQYGDFMTKLNALIPTYAAQARQAYDKAGDDLMNRFNLAMGMENQEYARGRDALADQRYENEWNQQLQAYQDDQAYRQWQMAQEGQDRAYQMVMQMIGTGQTPSAELLAQAGVSADYARSMANYYRQQAALAMSGGGSGGGGSSSSRTSNPSRKQNVTEDPAAVDPDKDKTKDVIPPHTTIKQDERTMLWNYAQQYGIDAAAKYMKSRFSKASNYDEVVNWLTQKYQNYRTRMSGHERETKIGMNQ